MRQCAVQSAREELRTNSHPDPNPNSNYEQLQPNSDPNPNREELQQLNEADGSAEQKSRMLVVRRGTEVQLLDVALDLTLTLTFTLFLTLTNPIASSPNLNSNPNHKSDATGECRVSSGGGVGLFGAYGDTSRKRIKKDKWTRVAVTVPTMPHFL